MILLPLYSGSDLPQREAWKKIEVWKNREIEFGLMNLNFLFARKVGRTTLVRRKEGTGAIPQPAWRSLTRQLFRLLFPASRRLVRFRRDTHQSRAALRKRSWVTRGGIFLFTGLLIIFARQPATYRLIFRPKTWRILRFFPAARVIPWIIAIMWWRSRADDEASWY